MTPFRIAIATVVATFALLLVGGTVNPTGSALACPDWPLCHGQFLPQFVNGVQYEHSHRLAAAAVVLATVLLNLVTWRSPGVSRRARRLVVALIPLVVLQAVLGGLTVIYKLPTLVATAHLGLAMAFFLLAITCVFWLHPSAGEGSPSAVVGRAPAALALAMTCAQILLGGFVRHTGAGRACGVDFPQCGGEWWPSLWAARANMLHRFFGVVVALVVVACAIVAARRAARVGRRLAFGLALAAAGLVVVQVLLGMVVVTSGIGFWQIMGHFTVAILLLGSWQTCFLALGPHGATLAGDARRAVAGAHPVQAIS